MATGSIRRRAHLAHLRPDVVFAGLRGNIGTRLEKAAGFDAIVMAAAALDRLGIRPDVADRLDPSVLLPQVGQGAMAAVLGATPEALTQICRRVSAELGQVVSPANFNSPRQTVIAGDTGAVERACELAREDGAKRTLNLPVSAPFHCSLMAPAAEKLAPELAGVQFQDAAPPVLSNVEATPNREAARMAGLLTEQVTAPVRFTETIEQLVRLGVDRVLEVGPGHVLTGLVARTARRLRRGNFASMGDLVEACSLVSNT